MTQVRTLFKRIIIMIIIISIIISSSVAPNSYAKLTIGEGEFYYAGTTKGTYVPTKNIFSWMLDMLSALADFLLGIITMGIRMCFVGYTALAEKLLTWALETTSGVNLAGEDVNATDLTSLSNSTNNVTIQSIVYNMVPALDVNFFNTDYSTLYKKTIKEKDKDGNIVSKKVLISPTGQQLKCKKCGESVLKCCGNLTKTKVENNGIKCYGNCGCNGCEGCEKYAELMVANDPIIVQLKSLIAVWYYIIRLLAVAAMCVVLVGIGIKMAISTVASDKATYKRMLVDWVTGIILIFTMHYIMYFAITVNEILVDTIRTSADAVNKVHLAQLADTKNNNNRKVEVSNQDIEIDVYEEIRTRAYDIKMTVGLSGMIMYMALVFMAVKYTIVYIKRFLTLAVLTIMAPGLGVSYALQKALSGKSSSLKSWLSEYLLNLLIQVVHALIYAIFISQALKFTLESVSGIIVALILMNFSLKAEGIFRRIFNLDPGNKGLLGSTATAGDRETFKNNMNAMKGMAIGAKPLAKAITAPTRTIAKTAGKIGAAAALMGGSAVANAISNRTNENGNSDNANSESSENTTTTGSSTVSGSSSDSGSSSGAGVGASGTTTAKNEDEELLNTGEQALEEDLEVAKSEFQNDPQNQDNIYNVIEANRRLQRYREIAPESVSVGAVMAGHLQNLFSMDNYFDLKMGKDGKLKHVPKAGVIFGSYKYDPKKGKYVKDNSNAAYTQLGASKLLGFTDKDKKIFKEQVVMPTVKGIGGMASMFFGMGNLVAHPAIGMGMLSGGAVATGSMMKKFKKPVAGSPGRLKCLKLATGSKLPKRFRFGSFNTPALTNMRDNVVQQAHKELDSLVRQNVKLKHPSLYDNLKNDLSRASTLGNQKLKTYPNGNSAWDIVDKHHFKQIKDQMTDFTDEANELISAQEITNGKVKQARIMKNVEDNIDKLDDLGVAMLLEEMAHAEGKDIDISKNNLAKIEEEQTDENGNKVTVKRELTESEIKLINKKIDNAVTSRVMEKLEKTEVFDINDESAINQIIKEVSSELSSSGLIGNNVNADILFKNGMSGLKSSIKDKASAANNAVKSEMAKKIELNSTEFDAVKESIIEVATKSASKDGNVDMSTLNQEEILQKVEGKLAINPQDNSKDKKKHKTGIDSTFYRFEDKRYKSAIGTLLANQSNGNLIVNTKDNKAKGRMNNILNAQIGLDSTAVQDRITNQGGLSKLSKNTKQHGKEFLKRKTKRNIAETVDLLSKDAMKDSNGATVKIMTSKEKLKQAKEATKNLDHISKDAILESLMSITNMQENLQEINRYADETLTNGSKFIKKTNNKYLSAKRELSEARSNKLQAVLDNVKLDAEYDLKNEAEKQSSKDIYNKRKQSIEKQIQNFTTKVDEAEHTLNSVGPVQDSNKATKEVLEELKKK